MVLRRTTPYGDVGPRLLATFRRTRAQALGHGFFVGTVVGAIVVAVGIVVTVVESVAGDVWPYPWLWLLLGLIVPVVVGGIIGTLTGGRSGVDADAIGIHAVPALPRSFGPWPTIADIRAERRRGRTIVAVYLDSGAVLRLRAPYDGRLLGRNPRFERELFALMNLWETHRNRRSRT